MGPARRGGRGRAALGLGLAGLALGLAGLALGSSYWCEGRHRVAKEPCPGGAPGGGPGPGGGGNGTADPRAVQYLWEAGDDKFSLRYFHAGFWLSCEEHPGGEVCRSFIQLPPESEKGVLWLAVAAEVAHVALLSGGVGLLALELAAAPSFLGALKMDAFAALLTVLAGLLGMVAHTMYVAVFQLAVSLGPKDWRPHSWSYGWSFGAAWLSFALCMAAAVLALNAYTQTLLQLQRRRPPRGPPAAPPAAPPRQPGGDAEPC
ncbi:germ cell-specific gene 1-like protein [Dromaius novaehollandiae]|uniref:germ cell-specific gene 1-like protein n=1 Tax=Dromaius novaehollandiae TaxID=8790 RepID=UPI00311D360C